MSLDVNLFWDTRHKNSSLLQSGGDKGLTEAENETFYLIRIGRLLDLLQRTHGGKRPLSILDAGCGRGLFTTLLTRCGHNAVGIDVSPSAIDYARKHFDGKYHVGDLTTYRPDRLFDVVICIDVLFHLIDNLQWRLAFNNLSSACKSSGTFIFTDALEKDRRELGEYIVHRSRTEYTQLMTESGMRLLHESPYRFGSNINGFVVVAPSTSGATECA